MNDLGYKSAVRIATGMADWARSGYPVQTSSTDEELIFLPVDEKRMVVNPKGQFFKHHLDALILEGL